MKKKTLAVLASAVLGCGIASTGLADFVMTWGGRGSNYVFLEVDVPANCTVSISPSVWSSGGTYHPGSPWVWWEGTDVVTPYWTVTGYTFLEDAHVVGSFDAPMIYDGPSEAYVWATVYGGGNSYNKGEFRATTGSTTTDSWEYGTSTAGTYYVDAQCSLYGDGNAWVQFVIDW